MTEFYCFQEKPLLGKSPWTSRYGQVMNTPLGWGVPSHGGPSVGDAPITSPCVQGCEEKEPGQGNPCRMLEDGGALEQWERKWPLMWKLSFRKHNELQRSFINMAIVAPSLWWEQMVRGLCSAPLPSPHSLSPLIKPRQVQHR